MNSHQCPHGSFPQPLSPPPCLQWSCIPCYISIDNSHLPDLQFKDFAVWTPLILFIHSLFLWSLTTVITRTFILLNTLSSSFSWPSLESVVLYPTPYLFSQNQHCASCVLKQVHSGCFPSCSHQHTALPVVVICSLFLLFPKGGKKKSFFFSSVNRKETAISYQPRLIESSFNIVMGKRLNFSGTRMWG